MSKKYLYIALISLLFILGGCSTFSYTNKYNAYINFENVNSEAKKYFIQRFYLVGIANTELEQAQYVISIRNYRLRRLSLSTASHSIREYDYSASVSLESIVEKSYYLSDNDLENDGSDNAQTTSLDKCYEYLQDSYTNEEENNSNNENIICLIEETPILDKRLSIQISRATTLFPDTSYLSNEAISYQNEKKFYLETADRTAMIVLRLIEQKGNIK